MKQAMTLLELLFVIVLLGVLSSFALTAIPKNRAFSDAKHITSLINQKRFHAQGNQEDINCTKLSKADINNLDDTYQIQSELSPALSTLCFDWMGRVYDENNVSIVDIIDINVTAQGKRKQILIFPETGYAKINN